MNHEWVEWGFGSFMTRFIMKNLRWVEWVKRLTRLVWKKSLMTRFIQFIVNSIINWWSIQSINMLKRCYRLINSGKIIFISYYLTDNTWIQVEIYSYDYSIIFAEFTLNINIYYRDHENISDHSRKILISNYLIYYMNMNIMY